jgi:iron complex transport system ATP-binding protein
VTLRAEALCIDIGRHRIVEDVHLDITPGQLTVVVGANGAGKSTLLRALAGELSPSRGSVTMDGVVLGRWSRAALARVRAVLRQSSDVAFPMSCLDVALLGRLPHNDGFDTLGDHAIVRATLRSTGVGHLAERSYASLSGGEKQRVQLARALAQVFEPREAAGRYLLLDEPTSALDLAHQHVCLRLARRAAARGVGVAAVLHDLTLAARYADRVAVLQRGRVAACGEPQAVLTPDLVARVFGVTSRVMVHPRSRRPILVLGRPLPRPRSRNRGVDRAPRS